MNKLLRYSLVMLFALICGNMNAGTIVFGELGLENGVQYSDPFDGGDFTVTFAGGSNDGKYYNTGSGIRVYGGGTMSIAAKSGTLTKVVITYDGNNKPADGTVVDNGTYDAETGIWTGEGRQVTFVRPSGSGHWRVQKIEATVGSGSVTTKTATSIEFSGDYLTKFTQGKDGDKVDLPTATVKAGDAAVEGATVTWTLSKGSNWSADADPAINGTKVEFGDHSRGDLTLKASYAGNDTYEASSKSYTLKVYKGYMSIKSILEDYPVVGGDTWKAKEAEWNAGSLISYWQVDAKSETEFTSKEALVTFVSGSYTYIKDNDGCLLLYGSNLGFNKGDKISGDLGNGQGYGAIYGTLKAYNGLLELTTSKSDIEFVVKSSDNPVEAKTITVDQLTQDNMNEYLKIQNAEFVSASNKNLTFKIGDATLAVYNQFNVDVTALEAGAMYDLYGMGCIYYKNEVLTPQIYLIEFEKATGGTTIEDTWTVAGTLPLVDNEWDPTDTSADMMPNGNGVGVSSYEKDNIVLEAGTKYEFKICKNHSWTEAYPAQNYSFTVEETGIYHFKVFFNTTTHEIDIEKAKTGEAGPITHTYSVIGDFFGDKWTIDYDMTKGEDGLYKAEIENVAAGAYEFKVRADKAWTTAYPSSNYSLTVEKDGSNVTVTFNEKTEEVKAVVSMPIVQDIVWSFTSWKTSTVSALIADAANSKTSGWSDVEKKADAEAGADPTEASKDNCFWCVAEPNEDGSLSANGEVIEELKGLKWNKAYTTARSLAIAVNYPETSLGDYAGGAYLWLGGGGKSIPCFTIPGVKAGSTITMEVESHKPSDARGVELYAGVTEDGKIDAATKIGDSFKPTIKDTYTWKIEADGDVIVYNTSGCHLYSLKVVEGDATGISVAKTQKVQDNAVYNLAGQKVGNDYKGIVIVNGRKFMQK